MKVCLFLSWHRSPTVADCRKQRHALLTDTDDVVLNLLERNYSRRSESACVQRGAEGKMSKPISVCRYQVLGEKNGKQK